MSEISKDFVKRESEYIKMGQELSRLYYEMSCKDKDGNLHAYNLISRYYAGKFADRSGVPYINHIDEGLTVLGYIDADIDTQAAYCLHPLFQSDGDLLISSKNMIKFENIKYKQLIYVMEYRNIANAYLSPRKIESISEINLSPIQQVNDMLIADKIQNYKDFLKYHDGHVRWKELNLYFLNWFKRLDVDHKKLMELIE